MNSEASQTQKITGQDEQLIHIMRDVNYGQIVVTIRDGKPVHVEEIRKSIQIK